MWAGIVQAAGIGPAAYRLNYPALYRLSYTCISPPCFRHGGRSVGPSFRAVIHIQEALRSMQGASCTLGADNGNRTHLRGLGSRRSADELYPHMPCRNFTGAPLRKRRACTYRPRLEGRRILRAASAPLVSETGVEPGEQGTSRNPVRAGCEPAPCPHDFRPYCFGVWRLSLGRPATAVRGKRWKARAASISPLILLYDTPPRGFLTFRASGESLHIQ